MQGKQFIGDAGSSVHSAGSSSQGNATSASKQLMYQDDLKLQTMIKLYSALENQEHDLGSIRTSNQKSSWGMLMQIEREIVSRLFKINHVILNYQAVSLSFYQLVMLFEFIQLIFFIFYKVEIVNEFKSQTTLVDSLMNGYDSLSQQQFRQNSTFGSIQTDYSNMEDQYSQIQTSTQDKFRLDQMVAFINFQIYVLSSDNDFTFIAVYAFFQIIFIIFVSLLFGLSKSLFEQAKSQEIKESTKFLLKFLSILMSLYLFLLQIPYMTILLQGYKCEENPEDEYVILNVPCNSIQYKVFILLSTLSIVLYASFLITQQILFTTNDFDSELPWASFERKLSVVRCLYKFLLSASFIFDKAGRYRVEMGLTCFFINAFIVQQRLTGAILFHKSIHYATILYEMLVTWLFLTVSLHILFDTEITIIELVMVVSCSISFSIILLQWQKRRKISFIMIKQPTTQLQNSQQLQTYFFRINQLIQSHKKHNLIAINGIFNNHIELCQDPICSCAEIIESMDKLKHVKMFKEKQAQECQALSEANNRTRCFGVNDIITGRLGSENQGEPQSQMMQVEQNFDSISVSMVAHSNTDINLSSIPPQRREHEDSKGEQYLRPQSTTKVISALDPNYASQLNNPYQSVNSVKIAGIRSFNTTIQDFDFKNKGNSNNNNNSIRESLQEIQKSEYAASKFSNLELSKQQIEYLQFLDEADNEIFSSHEIGYQKRQFFKFVAQLVNNAIQRFPQCIDLKIISSSIYRQRLGNEFKAVFELMNCDVCNPSLYNQFIIFRRKLDIENILVKQNIKNNMKIGYLDVVKVFNYEKYYQRYQLHEYLTVHATLAFWRELLQREIDASILQQRGSEISQNYLKLQEAAKETQQINPDDIKFLIRQSIFLLNIANNEFEAIALLERAQSVFQNKVYRKGTAVPINEQTIFGENSAAAIIIISATSKKIGTIVYSNEEIEHLLGYNRRDIIGKNVKELIPLPMSRPHDYLIQRYFETAKPNVIEIRRTSFAANIDNYLKEVQLLVKVYPFLNNKIMFVGFMQKCKCIEDMEPVKQELEGYEIHYIMTDQDGYITNVTEGLNYDMGLHAKFFQYRDNLFQQKIHISQLCAELSSDYDLQEQMKGEGAIVTIDTRNVINSVELEGLTAEEIIEVKSNMALYKCNMQFMNFVIDPRFCIFNVYRVIIIGRINEQSQQVVYAMKKSAILDVNLESTTNDLNTEIHAFERSGQDIMCQDVGSVVSGNTSTASFTKIVQDFKKTIGDKKTPKNVRLLNRLIVCLILITLGLQVLDYQKLGQEIEDISGENEHNLNGERRAIETAQLAINIRSFINIANGLEFNDYSVPGLNRIADRFELLGRQIQLQGDTLTEIHQFMTQKRVDSDAGTDQLQSAYEYLPVELFRLSDKSQVAMYHQPFRVALDTFLNQLQQLNLTEKEKIRLPDVLMLNSPQDMISKSITYNTTLKQRAAYYLISNGLRSLRLRAREAIVFQQSTAFSNLSENPFLIIMIVAIFVTFISIILVIFSLWQIERVQAEILSLYAHLKQTEVSQVYYRCCEYLNNLNNGTLIKMVEVEHQELKQESSKNLQIFAQSFSQKEGYSLDQVNSMIQGRGLLQRSTNRSNALINEFKKQPQIRYSQISEEEKENRFLKQYIASKSNKRQNMKVIEHHGQRTTKEFYQDMLNSALQIVKQFQEQDEGRIKKRQTQKLMFQRLQSVSEYHHNHHDFKSSRKSKRNRTLRPSLFNQKTHKIQRGISVYREDQVNNGPPHKPKGKQHLKSKFHKKIFGENGRNSIQGDAFDNEENKHVDEEIVDEEYEEEKIGENKQHDSVRYSLNDFQRDQNAAQFNRELNDNNDFTKEDEEIQFRKQYFFKTIKPQNISAKISIIIVALLFCGYFVQLFFYHQDFKEQIDMLIEYIPVYFNRYRYLMLSYALLRERIIYNNSLFSYEKDPEYGYHVDTLYNDLSEQTEKEISKLKASPKIILAKLSNYYNDCDSKSYCESVIGDQSKRMNQGRSSNGNSTGASSQSVNKYSNSLKIYQTQINSVIKACLAAERGDIQSLQMLADKGIDFNTGNYDRQTPLHIAVISSQKDALEFILNTQGINKNPVDRWGATPLNYAAQSSDIENILTNRGAIRGKEQPLFQGISKSASFELSDNDNKLYYACLYGDLKTAKSLQSIGWKVNSVDRNGRSPLHIAASEGYLDMAQFLVENGADIMILDNRDTDAVTDAIREDHLEVHEYLDSLISETAIKNYCLQFSDGIFAQGIQSAIGNFHKKFADLSIKINHTDSYQELMAFLNGTKYRDPLNFEGTKNLRNALTNFFTSHELYFSLTIDRIDGIIIDTYTSYADDYNSTTMTIFVVFLTIQLAILFVLRSKMIQKMKEDIIDSRGILNLIPNSFFEQNKNIVESLIKKIKE